MRFRDKFIVVVAILLAASAGWFGVEFLRGSLFASVEINRDDAKRHKTSPLSTDQWVEFQMISGANSFRLYTNAALTTVDAPDYDLSNPRVGWKYSIEYELLDANRKLLRTSNYHFRSTIRQLFDTESGETIYPLFFGKSGLVSTQTRTMQIAIRDEIASAAILRARLVSKCGEIKEVVARAAARVERRDFDKLQTWNRLSNETQESISKYCVYSHQLLTTNERNSLMRFCWNKCPTLGEFEHRLLFVIGDINDQDIREEQIPLGLYMDPRSLATIPVPEGHANVRLEFQKLEESSDLDFVSIGWQGASSSEQSFTSHVVDGELTSFEMPVNGGLLEFKPTTRLVVRAYWSPVDELARKTAQTWTEQNQYLLIPNSKEFELTPRPAFVRGQLFSEKPVEFDVTHLDGEPTPLRLQFRFPYGEFFRAVDAAGRGNGNQIGSAAMRGTPMSPRDVPLVNTTATWQFVDELGKIVDTGELKITPNISKYDRLVINGQDEMISDPTEYFLSVPNHVVKVRLLTGGKRMLANAYVRPLGMSHTIRVPEDYHAFSRIQSVNRSWFGLKPLNEMERIRTNLTFVIATQARPREPGNDLRNNDYQWVRYEPDGSWIGRQMLVPTEVEAGMQIKDKAAAATYFELNHGQSVSFERYSVVFGKRPATPKMVYVAEQAPGMISVFVDGKEVKRTRSLAVCGEINLSEIGLESSGQIEIRSENPAKLFVSGLKIHETPQYFRRTAQRLDHGQLHFQFKKESAGEELVTLRIFRDRGESKRCKVHVKIESPQDSNQASTTPKSGYTVMNRVYDLRPLSQAEALMLGHGGQVDSGYKCFVRLGEDLPRGDYTIRVDQLDEESDGYVLLYQTIVEESDERSPDDFVSASTNPTEARPKP